MTPQLQPLPCYLNGQFTTIDKAQISPMDRGFIFGDGIYEVVPIYNSRPFGMDDHLSRLEGSLAETRIKNPHPRAEWKAMFSKLAAACEPNKAYLIYLQVTRGVAMRDHVMTEGISPTVFAFIQEIKPLSQAARDHGVACVSADDFRWTKAHLKSTSLLGAVFSRQISYDAGCVETVMFRGEVLSEASSSNVWVIKNGKVMGAKSDSRVLRGIRYGVLAQLCSKLGLSYELRDIQRHEVLAADELLLSSATKEVLAITTLDGKPVGGGKPGPVYQALYQTYQEMKAQA
jgi:D-alanine transaminase